MADDGLQLHPNGTVTATIDGTSYRLRRPKAGEYFDFLETLEELSDATRIEGQAILDDRRQQSEQVDGDLDAETVAALRKRERQLQRDMNENRMAWLRKVFSTLCDTPLPDQDDMPVWMMQEETITEMVKQWRTVPIHRGES